ncbi:MAG: flagellar biosynthesis protein [Candidatus Riflebacteria bacterium]|nr:flagellar biosynthesis protein [Candidatus Riflebacteria bacterium]
MAATPINLIPGVGITSPSARKENNNSDLKGPKNFGDLLQRSLSLTNRGLVISAHASKRINERNMKFSGDIQKQINDALDELQAKGAKDSLILTKTGAFLVNVPSRTLVTAMAPEEMQDKIVTQIDSVSIRN